MRDTEYRSHLRSINFTRTFFYTVIINFLINWRIYIKLGMRIMPHWSLAKYLRFKFTYMFNTNMAAMRYSDVEPFTLWNKMVTARNVCLMMNITEKTNQ